MFYWNFWSVSFTRLYNFQQIFSCPWRALILCFFALALPALAQNAPSPKPQILPKEKAPGVDFIGMNKHYYIVRSDLGYYMKSTDFHKGKDLEVFSLHHSCRGGDHYFAHKDRHFYIIKGDQYRCVRDLNKDQHADVFILHRNCRGGDHYLSAFGYFYIIFQTKGVYRQVKNLTTDKDAIEYPLHPNSKKGLYYWGTKNYCYFVLPHDRWGAQYFRTTNFSLNYNSDTYSFHADVVNFLPGGLGITHGSAFGRWEAIKTISNDLNSPITWSKKITKKVGFTRQKMSSIERNWKVGITASLTSGTLMEALCKFQFSISTEFGGRQVNTEQEQWSEAIEIEESISTILNPQEKGYLWQYQLGLGRDTVLFCRSLKFTKDPNPPTEIPLPPSEV